MYEYTRITRIIAHVYMYICIYIYISHAGGDAISVTPQYVTDVTNFESELTSLKLTQANNLQVIITLITL